MSVLFATILPQTIILCADKLALNPQTGETQIVKKIEKWSPTIAVGGTGIKSLSEAVISGVRARVEETALNNYTLEEIADLFAQCYYAAREVYTDMPPETRAKFVVAGTLSNGRLGVIQVEVANDTADTEIIEASEMPKTVIHAPADMTNDECNQLFQRAIRNANKKKPGHQDLLESAHRKAVRYVSECSKWVGPKSDYIVITPDPTK